MDTKSERTVLRKGLGGGPKGLGDPEDKSMRKVEKDVIVSKIMRDITAKEKCAIEVGQFHDCVRKWPLLFVAYCRAENEEMKSCQKNWYENQQFRNECTEVYLKERSEYRRTGITKKQKEAQQSASENKSEANVI